MKGMMVKKGIQHYHDDRFSDEEIIIKTFWAMNTFGDFRILNGLPIDVADEFVAQLHNIFNEIAISQKKYKDYYKTHPNPLSTKGRQFV